MSAVQPRMSPGRRHFIRLAGGGAVLAALPLAGCSTEPPAGALRAWQDPGDGLELRRWMLAHGLLAPNPHNRQPWIADLRSEGRILLSCDGDRLLPQTDPFGRQILIGCGAFIELAVIAAAERGHRVRVETFPAGEPGPRELPREQVVARLSVEGDPGLPRDPLFAQIRRRHTHKGLFDSARPVPLSVWQLLQQEAGDAGLLAGALTEAPAMAALRRITREAFASEMLTPRTYLESARLLRIGPDEIELHRDGIALMDAQVRLMAGLGLFQRLEVPRHDSANFRHAMKRWAAHESGSGYFWIATPDNSRSAQIASGRAYVRAQLQATAAGVAMHPLSQALQEYPEVRPQREALRALLGFAGKDSPTLQMLARVGYGTVPPGPAPRRELGQLIRA